MTPSPQENIPHADTPNYSDERVVISGMSGLYPKARDVKVLSDILYNKTNPITTDNSRWDLKHPDLSNYIGMVPDINRFDSQFFKQSDRSGNTMDVMARKLFEQTYQAIFDAGLSPDHLSGKNVGVYIGSSFSEAIKSSLNDDNTLTSGLMGCSYSFFANRISYWLDLKGPSYTVDQACCSSIAVLEAAYRGIQTGECEAAIVGAASLCLHPQTMIHCNRIITLSPNGQTKSFDENADGCVKSEAVNVLFLQKSKDALRIYADIIHVKSAFTSIVEGENGPKFGFFRNAGLMAAYLKEFYKEANVSPNIVEYVEAFGAGAKEIDKAELEALEEVFCTSRRYPLVVGSVMSNIGYTEAASGIASITKVLIGYQRGNIAANLNCKNPRQDIAALKDKRMIIATEHQPISRSYMAINNLSYNGVNAHVLLHGHFKPKTLDRYKSNLPRLLMVSGRHKNAVKRILDDIISRPIDPEEIALLHNIHQKRINGHLVRGYAIVDTNSDGTTVSLGQQVERFDDAKRPLWFVYSGMGSQWAQMGTQLMHFPVFAATIKRCHEVLKPKRIDLIHILTTEDETIFDNILHAFVGITSVQIGLTNVLRDIGIIPDNIIGHSLGELVCAYADDTFTLEETILASYARGRVSLDVPVIKGSMAAVGLGYQQIKNMLPSNIYVACRNGPDSCTISGPLEAVEHFMTNLSSQGIFAKQIYTENIAYHSKYIKDYSEPHLNYLREIIKTPKPRSQRWISTSIPQDRWHDDLAKFSSAEYHDNNMGSPVLFEEALNLVPSNAVMIEIAPHGLLQGILKRSLSSNCHHISLWRRGYTSDTLYLFNSLGSLYMEGYNPEVAKIYPKVEFPVSTETPSISHLVEWMHDEQCNIPLYSSGEVCMSSTTKNLVTLHDKEFQYLQGNVVGGRILYPYAAAIVAVWDTLTMSLGIEKKKLSVHFRDVQLFAQPILHEQKQLRLNVFLHRGTGKFEVSESSSIIATGYIIGNLKYLVLPDVTCKSTESLDLESGDVYELLHERDYSYTDEFRSIYKANASLTEAQLLWTDNWVTLIDGILQLNALRVLHSTVCQPMYIRRICIDVDEHINKLFDFEDKKILTAHVSDVHDTTKCGGVTLNNIRFHKLPPLIQESVTLKTYKLLHFHSSINGAGEDYIPSQSKSYMKYGVVLQSTKIGDIPSLEWVEASESNEPGITVDVHFAGLNDCDVKRAMGILPFKGQDFIYGMDFSGKIASGIPVMGLIHGGAIRSKVIAKSELLWNVPSNWSLEGAATVPLAYSMAFYCLKLKGNITHGMTILIWEADGALGQAMISIALAYNCKVFTTVTDLDEKQFLLKLFPEVNAQNIGYSRDTQFETTVLKATKGKGCDIVVTGASGDLKKASLNCCSSHGTSVDIAQIQRKEKFAFGLLQLIKPRSYVVADFYSIFECKEDMQRIKKLVSEGIEKGYVRPLTYVTYDPKDIVAAFRWLESKRRSERVLIKLCNSSLEAESRFTCTSSKWQIVFCDDVVGIQFTDKLISNGARRIILNYSNLSGYLKYKIGSWAKIGVEVNISTDDLSKTSVVESVLKNVTREVQVEGIFALIKNSVNKEKDLERIVSDMDAISRKVCPDLKNFVVISNNRICFGENVYLARKQDELPILVIHLPFIEDMNGQNNSNAISKRGAIDAIFKALPTSTANVFAYLNEKKRTSLLEELAYITGVDISKHVSVNTTLQELGILDNKTHVIKSYLRDTHNTYLEENVISSLTVQKIREIEKNTAWYGFKDVRGLEMFYSHIGSDETVASTTTVVMKTRARYWREHEFDVNTVSLCVIPGFEGHYKRFQLMCERLKLPAYTLQLKYINSQETIRSMAERYAQALKKKIKPKHNFYLLGYEYGVLLALETVRILEKDGFKGTIFCIGQTPKELKNTVEEIVNISSKNGMTLENAIAKHFVNLIKDDDNAFAKIETQIKEATNWKEKLEICVEELVGHNKHTYQHLENIITSALNRIMQLISYEVEEFELLSKIVFIHSKSSYDPTEMQSYSKQSIVIHNLDTPLAHLAIDIRCATIINRYLGQDVLDLFEQNNLCETYLVNGNRFLLTSCPE